MVDMIMILTKADGLQWDELCPPKGIFNVDRLILALVESNYCALGATDKLKLQLLTICSFFSTIVIDDFIVDHSLWIFRFENNFNSFKKF